MTADHHERTAREDAHRALGAVHQAVRAEPAVAREGAAREERGEVTDDRGNQRDEQHPLPVEQRVHDRLLEDEGQHQRGTCQRGTEHRGPLHERTPSDSASAPVRDRACDLLFEGLEQAGRHDEDHRPEAVEGRVVQFRELMVREDLEAVRGHTRDQQARADRVRAVGDVALGGVDEALGARSHGCAPWSLTGQEKGLGT